jgi:hypothetical protein
MKAQILLLSFLFIVLTGLSQNYYQKASKFFDSADLVLVLHSDSISYSIKGNDMLNGYLNLPMLDSFLREFKIRKTVVLNTTTTKPGYDIKVMDILKKNNVQYSSYLFSPPAP